MAKAKRPQGEEWIRIVSEKLKEMRIGKGYTSYETFALDHGLDRKQYWRVEKGANITLKTLIKILEVHKIDLPGFFKELARHGKR
jgi:hypothetical protein